MKTNRSSGLILHITSLPGKFGIGDLGQEAYDFVDLLAESGFRYWQLLPLNPIEKQSGYSPYSSTSAFAGNTALVSPELLRKDGFLTQDNLEIFPDFNAGKVNYGKAIAFKNKLLRMAYSRFKSDEDAYFLADFQKFRKENKAWLHNYAFFKVLDETYDQVSWTQWPEALRDRKPEATLAAEKEHWIEIEFEEFCQFLFYRQWENLKSYAHQKGILFFGDLPFYVSFDSAEVWANPENFKLDAERKPVSVSGVPPDYFSENGQLWGTPIYNWKNLKKQKFSWWIDRLAHNLKLFDVARLDHFRAFYDYWEVPAGEKTAVNGAWKDGPADDFFIALQEKFPEMPFIAEDLGEVGPGVYELRDRFDLPGMVVLQYGFGNDIARSVFALHNHTPNMIAYTGTHDNNTTKGWWKNELQNEDRERVKQYFSNKVTANNVSDVLIRAALMSVAELAIFPLQDLLNLDEKALMNRPSIGEGNWRWRVTEAQLNSIDRKKWRDLLELYGRVPK